MKQRPWEVVLAAFVQLGCVVIFEDEFRVRICRGATVIEVLRKMSPVTVIKQRSMLDRLSFTEPEYLEKLEEPSA